MYPWTRFARRNARMLVALAVGGAVFQISFSGCDTALRDTLLTGIQTSVTGLVSTFIAAFFQALMSDSSTSQPIVQAVFEALPTLA